MTRSHAELAVLALLLATSLMVCPSTAHGQEGGLRSTYAADSLGVPSRGTVESVAPLWTADSAWRLSVKMILQIGVGTGGLEYELYRVANAVRQTNGQVIVANSGTHQLLVYDAAGRFQRKMGSRGEGPGEFRALAWVALVGLDSIVTWDPALARLSYFQSDGTFVGSARVEPLDGRLPALFGAWQDGQLLGSIGLATFREGIVHDSVRHILFDSTGRFVDSLRSHPNREFFRQVSRNGSKVTISGFALPFPRVGRVAIAPEGYYFGTGDSYEIHFFSRTGEYVRRVRRVVDNQPVTPEIRREWEEMTTSSGGTENVKQVRRRVLGSLPFPETLPAYRDLISDDLGNLWVREYSPADNGVTEWQVFDPEGLWLGTVAQPPRFEPTHIGADFVLGTWEDSLGIEYVQMYRLLKARE